MISMAAKALPRHGLLLVMLLSAPATWAQAQSLSFAQALSRLEQHNESLAAERQTLEQHQAELAQAQGHHWPELALKGGVTRLGQPIELDLDPVRRAILRLDPAFPPSLLPEDIRVQKRDFGAAALITTMPLYTGGRIQAGVAAAEAGLAAGHAQYDAHMGSLRLALVERYFAQVMAEQALQLKQASAESLTQHRDHARLMEREGQIARAELLRAEVALSEARREVDSARHDLALTQAALAALLASAQVFQPSTALPAAQMTPELEPLLTLAVTDNPALRAAREQHQRAEAGVQAARGERLPTLALFGQRELYTQDLNLYDPRWAVGVVLDWKLLDGGVGRNRVGAAQAVADEVSYRLAAGQRDIGLLVRQRHHHLQDALGRIESYQATRELAQESLRSQRRAFEEGLASSLDVVDAELALQRVELGTLAARYEALVARAGLLEVVGQSQRIGGLIEDGQ